MVNLDIILGRDLLDTYIAILDFYVKIVTLGKSTVLRLAWKVILNLGSKDIISSLHTRCMMEWGFLSYLAHIYDTIFDSPLSTNFT